MPPCHLVMSDETDSSPVAAAEKVYQYFVIKIDPVVQLVRMPPCHLVKGLTRRVPSFDRIDSVIVFYRIFTKRSLL